MLVNQKTKREYPPVFSNVHRLGEIGNFTFDWASEMQKNRSEVWRLSVASYSHSLAYISLSVDDGFVLINLMERELAEQRAAYNNIGVSLISFACLRSVEEGFGGI